MPLSEAAAEMVERHCSSVDGLFEAVSAALDNAKITQVMMISSLTTTSIDELTSKIATGDLKDMRLLVDTSLRACVKGCQFQLDLCKAGQKVMPVNKNEKEWATQMRKRAIVLKNLLLSDHIPVELMPPPTVWKRLTDNPSSFVNFGKELVEAKPGKDSGSRVNSDPMKVEFLLNDVPQSLTLPREDKSTMGGALWSQCFQRYCVALMLATVTPEKVQDKAKLDIDWLSLQGYGYRVSQVASLYGWEMAQEVDESFRRFIERAYSEAHISLCDCFNNISKFSQLKVDARLNTKDLQREEGRSRARGGGGGNLRDAKATNGQKKKRKRGLCYKFLEGDCSYGDNCNFLHERSGTTATSKAPAGGKKK
ncbi:hypothetical protein Pmar_PMAR019816 [Perkinsus marinus ATCC 50983]|uniref:C3H1-type domain-containing protein n=1 Tax=Perkinsus marinus (strain ATCC 50983 / TXsc) TaxID=423536 RepID=C5LRJ7_PERM5|nr:hypothetical protein Pmar_PMAR019816 [Perkinsus marinus ATCC 50983]EER00660.1 hypothetical protein Pmar_PMAR019816 [Perkinsus marinus ATCC 50983]|eukprot:XP_002767942.1 hypothetical protein Pmar_PMAR019816 [Perkinsus marinus ATCC 50983]